jgi:hypothetical protein
MRGRGKDLSRGRSTDGDDEEAGPGWLLGPPPTNRGRLCCRAFDGAAAGG